MRRAIWNPNQLRFAVTVLMAMSCCPAGQTAAQDDLTASAEEAWKQLLPIIERSCLDCHAGDNADGSLDLEQFTTIDQVVDQRRLWTRIATHVRDLRMPPADGPELEAVDRKHLLDWIDNVLPNLSCTHEHHAGPVTIRRLTRYEYANTIRELFAVDYPVNDSFPKDEVGYGFDNIGDVLSISPLLFEKYLVASEAISNLVIVDPLDLKIDRIVGASEFGEVAGGHVRGSHMILTTRGTISVDVNPLIQGRYRIEVVAFGQQAGDESAKMAVSVSGKLIDEFKVLPDNSDDAASYEVTAKLRKGRNRIEVTFTNDYYNPQAKERSQRDRNLGVVQIRINGPQSVPRPSKSQQAFLFATPDSDKSARQCAEEIINLYASRAFRRKIYAGERTRLLALFDLGIENGESFEGAMKLVVQALLVSPHFLYKIEAPAPLDGSVRHLSNYELATAVAYFLWSSMPDDELFLAATEEALSDENVLARQVQRMLNDERSIALVDNFGAQWLQLRLLDEVDPDPDLYPGFTDHLRDSMRQETRLLLRDIIQKDAPLTSLLTSEYTYLNKALARHYGWSTRGLTESGFTRVSLADKQRRGLLSHASFLTLTSNPTRTSPVKRGKWILENLLADPPPPALPDVPALDSQKELTGSLRERMEQHRADPNCAVCHYKMDSLGFALENYDAFGKFRERDEGKVIDTVGELPGGLKFRSAAELQGIIIANHKKQFVRCVVEKLYVYALGRGPRATDDCVIDEIAHRAIEQDYRFSDIALEIVTSEAFLGRTRPVNLKRK